MIIFMTNSDTNEYAHIYLEGNTLYIETSRSKWVPAYLYYMVEHWNSQSPVQIQSVCFTIDGAFKYNVSSLKDKKKWIEIKGEDL